MTHSLVRDLGCEALPVPRFTHLWWADVKGEPALHRDHIQSEHPQIYKKLSWLVDEFHSCIKEAPMPSKDISVREYLEKDKGWKGERDMEMADILLAQTSCTTLGR